MSLLVPINASFGSSKYSLQQEVEDDEDDHCISIEAEEGFLHKAESPQLSVEEEEEEEEKEEEEEEEKEEEEVDPPTILLGHAPAAVSNHPLTSLLLPPPWININDTSHSLTHLNVIPRLNPPSLPPPKHHFISASLPGSTTASPRAGLQLPHMKNGGGGSKKWSRNQLQADHRGWSSISRQETFGLESHLLRSKSCGEGRTSAPSDLFDIFSRKLSSPLRRHQAEHKEEDHNVLIGDNSNNKKKKKKKKKKGNNNSKDQYGNKQPNKKTNYHLKFFKCTTSALCLLLPAAFVGREKGALRSAGGGGDRRRSKYGGDQAAAAVIGDRNNNVVISRTVSLEKFECGSWSSSAIIKDDYDDDCDIDHHDRSSSSIHHHQQQLYFDLPLELIQNCGRNDHTINFPTTTALFFDRADSLKVKGKGKGRGAFMIMKKKTTSPSSSSSTTTSRTSITTTAAAPAAKKSHDQSSSRLQVPFSTSSGGGGSSPASCITPRLRKARDDFNAFLQAHNAN